MIINQIPKVIFFFIIAYNCKHITQTIFILYEKIYYLTADSIHVEFVKHNLKVLNH
jgi:hypothetical protein